MVDILLATYNGEKYIKEQIDSLFNQTYKNIRIIVRDDGSSDKTCEILDLYEKKYADKFVVVKDKDNKLHGATYNFTRLLSFATSQYVMFCDQDDYWLPDKVEITLKKMKQLEKHYGEKPILVYSDYKTVDSNLKDIDIKEKSMHIHGHHTTFNRLLVQNYVTGCTMMVNRCLYQGMKINENNKDNANNANNVNNVNNANNVNGENEYPYSEDIIMHDWWIALYAASFGAIYHLKKTTMLYRQHGKNVYGAVAVDSVSYINKQCNMEKKENAMNKYFRQAEFFKKHYFNKLKKLNKCNSKVLMDFLSIRSYCKVVRVVKLIKGGYLKGKLIMKLGQIWLV